MPQKKPNIWKPNTYSTQAAKTNVCVRLFQSALFFFIFSVSLSNFFIICLSQVCEKTGFFKFLSFCICLSFLKYLSLSLSVYCYFQQIFFFPQKYIWYKNSASRWIFPKIEKIYVSPLPLYLPFLLVLLLVWKRSFLQIKNEINNFLLRNYICSKKYWVFIAAFFPLFC